MAQKAYGSITIVDINDLGTLSVYPESNSPRQIVKILDNGTYNPNWTKDSPLILKPTINYSGESVTSNYTIKWYFRKGLSGQFTEITNTNSSTGTAYKDDDMLKVPNIPFNDSDASDTNITYKCEVNYTEQNTQQKLTAAGEISFSLIIQPATTRYCTISGEGVFKYNSSKNLVGATTITLSARVVGCSVSKWQYEGPDPENNSTLTWLDVLQQNSTNVEGGTTLVVRPDGPYFNNGDTAKFKLVTDKEGIYDVHSITKLYDGAAGTELFVVALSNEDSYVACDDKGNPVDGAFDKIYTGFTVYYGDDEIPVYNTVTSQVNSDLAIVPTTSGVTGAFEIIDNKYVYKISGISAPTGFVEFKVTYTYKVTENGVEVTKTKTTEKTMYLTKLKAGANGVTPTIYRIKCASAIKRNENNTYEPLSITAESIYGATSSSYRGQYEIYNGGTKLHSADKLIPEEGSTSINFTVPTTVEATLLTIKLYTLGTTEVVDTQSVTIVKDGKQGNNGVTFVFSNPTEQIPCDSDGKTSSAGMTINIPFSAYEGTTRLDCDFGFDVNAAPNTSKPNGIKVYGISGGSSQGTTTTDGNIKISVAGSNALDNNDRGILKFTLTAKKNGANYATAIYNFTWAKNKQGVKGGDGVNAVLFRVYSQDGNVINNGDNDVTLVASLLDGAADVTDKASYSWYVFNQNSAASDKYDILTTTENYVVNSNRLTVKPGAVESFASYKVTATYPTTGTSKTYTDYMVVLDKTDPLQVAIYSTLGDKITNSTGYGCVYARIYMNGNELDEIKNLTYSTKTEDRPSSGEEGDVWIYLDTRTKVATPHVWTDGKWDNTKTFNQCNYKWTFADKDGKQISFNSSQTFTSKFVYIDGSLINKKTQFYLEVTKN